MTRKVQDITPRQATQRKEEKEMKEMSEAELRNFLCFCGFIAFTIASLLDWRWSAVIVNLFFSVLFFSLWKKESCERKRYNENLRRIERALEEYLVRKGRGKEDV